MGVMHEPKLQQRRGKRGCKKESKEEALSFEDEGFLLSPGPLPQAGLFSWTPSHSPTHTIDDDWRAGPSFDF
jgi:hypothetical protein